MAGWGSRLRPHTLTVPKPMLKVAGKSIVERLISNIYNTIDDKIESITFIIRNDFGAKIEQELMTIASQYNTKGIIQYQEEPLGTAHAIYCAGDSLQGPIIVGFADTMFDANFKLDEQSDAIIWVKQIPNPEAFGVINTNPDGTIKGFVEKPKEFVSDLAIIGIYYFKDGANLREEIKYLLDNNITDKGEFQLTTALENMRVKGKIMRPGTVTEWLDCGNKNATVESNQEILKNKAENNSTHPSAVVENSMIIPPCYIAEDVIIKNSIVGPYVSIMSKSVIDHSVVENSIVQEKSTISYRIISNSMIGANASINGRAEDLSVGDYNQIN